MSARNKRRSSITAVWAVASLVSMTTTTKPRIVSASSSGFPGTIQSPLYLSKENDDEQGQPGEGESSSDWDDALIMEEDPLAFVEDQIVEASSSLSSLSDDEATTKMTGENVAALKTSQSLVQPETVDPPPPPPQQQPKQESNVASSRASDGNDHSNTAHEWENKNAPDLPKVQNSNANNASSDTSLLSSSTTAIPKVRHHGLPSNEKPLKTLQKLQQLLDETDYLTSSSSAGTGTAGVSAPEPASSSTGSLWTSKDRTKYKKQQRLQKEQIRLKHQQEEQLRQKHQPVVSETEELSDTDDGLGYTLPNLPIYLSDGEDDTDETYPLPPSSEVRSVAVSQRQTPQTPSMTQQQYLQQQRELFFAQKQRQQEDTQQQPPTLHQNPYYPGGPYPPPHLPPGYYPYPPYYNGGPPPLHQYPSYFPYPTSGLPRMEPTVPRNPNHRFSPPSRMTIGSGESSATQSQSTDLNGSPTVSESESSLSSDTDNSSTTSERKGPNKAAASPPSHSLSVPYPYYSQPEQQEQWHIQQLELLRSQEQYRRQLQKQHDRLKFIAKWKHVMETSVQILDASRKLGTCFILMIGLCFAAVSPRNLPYLQYNEMAYRNLRLIGLAVLPPLIGHSWLIVDWNQVGRMALGQRTSSSNQVISNTNGETRGSLRSVNNNALTVTDGSTIAKDADHPTVAPSALVMAAIRSMIHSFYSSFIYGYLWVFGLEIVWTTILRLGVFFAWEPDMFGIHFPWSSASVIDGVGPSDTTKVPPLWILPWVLREYKYRPKRITVLAADILTSCVACPIIEEFAKLRLLQWSMPLSKNFRWVLKSSKHHIKQKKKMVAEPIEPSEENDGTTLSDEDSSALPSKTGVTLDGRVTNINPYISGMLAVSLGIKLADAIRRICMYTKEQDERKGVYAFLRGLFPVQELCGIMTALRLAHRDVLGQRMPLWNLILPAVIVHSMANLRGMKPIFKWNSSTPWAEMQLSPDLFPGLFSEHSRLMSARVNPDSIRIPENRVQWIGRAFPKIMWLIILFRVTGYCVKNYFMINRQAMKRATMYAGKHAAFSAELETAAKLKNTKD